MASIIPHAGGKWRALVRRTGFTPTSKVFLQKRDAEKWARQIESQMDSRTYRDLSKDLNVTAREIFERYLEEVTPTHKGERRERIFINVFLREAKFLNLTLDKLRSDDIRIWRNTRLGKVSPSSVNREMNVISAVFSHAIKEWGFPMPNNPVSQVKRPPQGRAREKRWSDENIEAMLLASGWQEGTRPRTGEEAVGPALLLAIETAMRLGEICRIRVSDYLRERRGIQLRNTKNGFDRQVPLTSRAVELVDALALGRREDDLLLGWSSPVMSAFFARVRKKAGIENEDLTFHDTRHEATTRLSKIFPNIMELSEITGHKSMQMLKRYYNPTLEELVSRLD